MAKILIIEDDAAMREETLRWLTLEAHDVLSAENGVSGVKHAFAYQPNLIICSISLPQLDGYSVLAEIRANPATVDIPFIFLTTTDDYQERRERATFETDSYIAKPFTPPQLLEAVQSRLKKKAAQEQAQQHQINQLTEALAQEHEQRLLKVKLVAMFAHDFRNPLTSILSSNSLLHDFGDLMDASRRTVHKNRIDASVWRLLQMLDEMVLISQLESTKPELKLEPLNVGQFFQRIAEEFQAIHEDYHILFESRFSQIIMIDPRLLQQIAANLISNAIKYSPEGNEVHITLDKDNEQFLLVVQDHGIGIPAADQIHLFEAFQRGSNVADVVGTGLGLAIVKQAVELHRGSIQFDSKIGVGTTITVIIPIYNV